MEIQSRPERITMKTIWHDLMGIFNLERGLLYTLVVLTIKPGAALREYLYDNRQRLVPPFRFLIFTVAIGTFITVQYFKNSNILKEFERGVREGYQSRGGTSEQPQFLETYLTTISDLYNNYFNLFILAGVPIVALTTFWFFRKNMNYAEHLVINSYLTAYATVIYIVLTPMLWITDYSVLSVIHFALTLVYSAYLYIQVFEQKIGPGIAKTLLINSIYIAIYYTIFFFVLIGIAIFLTTK